ncbi:MAG: protein kinase [Planctomycetes bacterium]|nr:protein kinase [Planctomycetota bacterium]
MSLEPADLTSPQEPRLRQLVGEFENAWRRASSPSRGPDLRVFLPPPDDPLRRTALEELIKTDCLARWQRGQGSFLEQYLTQFEELGSAEELSPDLILAEYRARHLHGDCPLAAVYSDRFPVQFPLVHRQMQQEGTFAATPPPEESAPSRPTQSAEAPPFVPLLRRPFVGRGEILPPEFGYRLLKVIGRGGFGQVWRAEAPGGVEAAIKIIFRPSDHEDIKRELQSLELIRGLRHPFLLATHAYWSLPDRLIIAMELADGTLNDRLKECVAEGQAGIPPVELVGYFKEAAEAVDFLHHRQVLHRDIKPANLLLLNSHVKVADFGLVRLQESMRSVEATFCGTPQYMPPEIWERKVCPASDQFSLALTYAELRLGCRPFSGRNLPEVELSHREQAPHLTALGEDERRVLLKALAKDPANRYPSCRDFVVDLEAIFPISVRPSGGVPLLEKADSGRRTKHMDTPPLSLPSGGVVTPPTSPGAAGRRQRPGLRFAGWAALLTLVLATVAWFVAPLLLPAGSLELEVAGEQTLAPGRAIDFDVRLARSAFGGPVPLTFSGLPEKVRAANATADAGAPSVRVRLTAERDAPPGDYRIWVETSDGPKASASFLLTIPLLPANCDPLPDAAVVTDNKRKLYERIVYNLPDGKQIEFILIPQAETDDQVSFYIMKDKVRVRDFTPFVRRHGIAWKPRWGDDYPALGVRIQDAHAFATRWVVGGDLPSTRQWDRAAGFYEKGRGTRDSGSRREGPYLGKWEKAFEGKGKVAVGLDEPMKVGEAKLDISPFGCRDMSGNGFEWTRNTTEGFYDPKVPLKELGSLRVRGQYFMLSTPLQFDECGEGKGKLLDADSREISEAGFRVVLRP